MRRAPSPNQIAFISALAVAVLSTAFFILISFVFYLNVRLEMYISSLVATFFMSWILFRYVLTRVVYNKIKVIYKAIGKPLQFEKEVKQKNNLLKTVERDVADWAINKNKQIRSLRQMAEYRKEFVGTVSHELKTPMFNAIGYVETVLDSDLDDKVFIRNYLEKTVSNLERLESIVKDLLQISKFEAGRIELHLEAVDLIKLIKEVLFHYKYLTETYKVNVVVHAKENEFFVCVDKNAIRQVLENLISNSVKYGKENGQTDIYINDLDEQYLVEISDNGIGISQENIDRVFERFFRADKSRSKLVGGTGLGLSIVRNIIQAHNQNINVTSELNKGTTFSFTLDKYIEE
ncbi:MAG: sensor histidine kinase [Chitinophagales bacterium]|nr:sensor histidine kinase [Chitinophagales bacterium]